MGIGALALPATAGALPPSCGEGRREVGRELEVGVKSKARAPRRAACVCGGAGSEGGEGGRCRLELPGRWRGVTLGRFAADSRQVAFHYNF